MTSGENERLAGRYRVIEQLGRGGMDVVWRAADDVLGREVAVKELRTCTDSSGPEPADLRARMQREARAAARVERRLRQRRRQRPAGAGATGLLTAESRPSRAG